MARIEQTDIAGVLLVVLDVHDDERGCFVETYRREWFPNSREMIQANRADRQSGCIVGLHYHLHQADYWYVPFGHARVVLHDLRSGSPTSAATSHYDLGPALGRNGQVGLYIPPGVAHGFSAIEDMTITYMVDGYYNKWDELGIAWDDPSVCANWGVDNPILSERDKTNPYVPEVPAPLVPHFWLR